jgi:hypothetical protein
MPNGAYADFIEDCRAQRASLTGLIEAILGHRMDPGMPIVIPGPLADATVATLRAFQNTVTELNTLIEAYDTNPDA